VINSHKPDVIVVNGGDNQFYQGGSLVMNKEDIFEVHKSSPAAKIISVHMEAVNHWALSRAELRSFIAEKGISENVLVPEDGEHYTF
ncbi:MBL fold metallo-hydrolase, partial [Burkholderia sp. SIMBA_024]